MVYFQEIHDQQYGAALLSIPIAPADVKVLRHAGYYYSINDYTNYAITIHIWIV